MSSHAINVLRLRVLAEDDPGVIARVLERFQNLNILPRRVLAESRSHGSIHIEVDVAGVPEQTLSLIAAKVGQSTCVVAASWHPV